MFYRYVTDKVHERLIELFSVSSSTGKSICDQVCINLKLSNINIKSCIGNATDGATNMQDQYNSFNTSWLQEEAGTQLHTRCYAHHANLVIMDIIENNHYSISLFGLLNSCAVFFQESYARINILKDLLSESRIKTISVIAQTRWWSKDNALKKIFDTFNDPNRKILKAQSFEIL